MAISPGTEMHIDEEAHHLLVRASLLVSEQLQFIGNLYYRKESVKMASTGSAGFVRGRGAAQLNRNRGEDGEIFRLNDDDYEKIVSYLEIPDHFYAITWGGRKTAVGKKYGSKAVVFKTMLAAIQHHGFPRQITSANLQKRFQRYVKRYKDAREFKLDTGGGLTQEEKDEGVLLEDKLNRLCPHFERMHALYGARPNIAPEVLGDVGVEENDIILTGAIEDHGDGVDDDWGQENLEPIHAPPGTPTEILSDQDGRTLQNENGDSVYWQSLDGIPAANDRNGMAVHDPACQCPECRNFVGVNSGESQPTPTESATQVDPQPLRPLHSNTPVAPRRGPKTPQQAAKEAHATTKPTFTAIYADRINLKADYRKELICSRDRWKLQDLEDRKAARREAKVEAEKQARLQRKHQLELESTAAENALKKARAEFEHAAELTISKLRATQEHENLMAKAARRTALLTTLFGSNKSPDEIKSLLPIVDQSEE